MCWLSLLTPSVLLALVPCFEASKGCCLCSQQMGVSVGCVVVGQHDRLDSEGAAVTAGDVWHALHNMQHPNGHLDKTHITRTRRCLEMPAPPTT